jgi:hypothetical protein
VRVKAAISGAGCCRRLSLIGIDWKAALSTCSESSALNFWGYVGFFIFYMHHVMQVVMKRDHKMREGQQDRILRDISNVWVCPWFCCIHSVTDQVWHPITCWSPRHEISQLFVLYCFQNTIRQFLCIFNNAAPGVKLIFVLFPENAGAVNKTVADVGKRCCVHKNGKNCRRDTVLFSCFPSFHLFPKFSSCVLLKCLNVQKV